MADNTGSGVPPDVAFGFGGFSLGDFGPTPPDAGHVKSVIDAAQQALTNLNTKINSEITAQVADSAVSADMLSQKAIDGISSQLQQTQSTLSQLQSKIHNNAVSEIGAALELSSPLGVVPPMPNQDCPVPTCVQIRIEAINHVYAAATEYYRCAGYPKLHADPMGRIAVLEFIQTCLSDMPSAYATITGIVRQIDNSPMPDVVALEAASQSSASRGSVSGQATIETPNSGESNHAPLPDGSGIPLYSVQTGAGTVGSIPAGLIALAAQRPDINVQTAPRPASVPLAVTQQQALSASQSCTPLWQFDADGYFIGGVFCPPASGCNPWPTTPPQRPGCVVDAYPPGVAGGCYEFAVTCPTDQPPAPPSVIPPTVPSPQPPPPVPGPEPKPPVCPEPKVLCPAPIINVNCPPERRPERPAPKPPKDKHPQICVYQSAETGVCYVVYTDDETTPQPNSPDDISLYCGPPDNLDIQSIAQRCCSQSGGNAPDGPAQFGVVPVGISGCDEFGAAPGVNLPEGMSSFSQAIGLRTEDGSIYSPFPDAGALEPGKVIVNGVVTFLATVVDEIAQVAQGVATQSGCWNGQQAALQGTNFILGFVGQYLGFKPQQLTVPNEQQRNYLCPIQLPDQHSSVEAWLANEIDEKTAECWIRAAGWRYPEWSTVARSRRSKFSALQWGTLRMRDKINDNEFAQHIRELGFIKDYDPQAVIDLLQQIPPPSDIIRMMIRDAADTINIDWTQEDAQFPQKYQGQLADWGRQQGIPESYMRLLWRAHYSIPAPGQLYQMLHRLSTLPQNDPQYVDSDQVRNALIQQDISPKWVDKLMAISFALLGRRDIQRAYQSNSISDKQTQEAYTKLGFSDDDILILIDSQKKQRNQYFLRRPEVRLYAAGAITNAEFDNAIRFAGADDDIVDAARIEAKMLRSSAMRKSCQRAYRRRFLTGDIDRQQVEQLLVGLGLESDVAVTIASGWQCEADARGREITAGSVNQLYQGALIDEGQYISRLRRLGFDSDDAIILLRNQQRLLNTRVTKAQQQAIRQAQRDADKMQREAQTAANRAAAAQRRAQAALTKARKVKQLRERRLIEAGEKWSNNSGEGLADSLLYIRALFNQISASQPYTADEIIAALLTIAEDKDISNRADYVAAVSTALTVQVPFESV